jgi:hypothetical protein
MIRSTDLDKLMLDLNSMEIEMKFVFIAIVFSFKIFRIAVVLVLLLAWSRLICIFIPILMMPISWAIAVNNGKILSNLGIHKDARVKIANEIIEEICFVKLYAGELAFNYIVGRLRHLEICKYICVHLGQSFEKAFSNCEKCEI